MKMYYVVNVRMPIEKAHGIQIAKMCEAFIEGGNDLELVVPRRSNDGRSVREFYGLRVDVPLIRLPAVDWYNGGRVGYALSSISFMVAAFVFLLWKRVIEKRFVIYTVDVDTFSSAALALVGVPLFAEMHTAKVPTLAQRILFRRARGVIAINRIIVAESRQQFPRSGAAYLVEPNGVDTSSFQSLAKREARTRLGLPQDIPIVLYAGRFFDWKGLEILPRAATLTPELRWHIVGGDKDEFKTLVNQSLPDNFFFAGSRPFVEMPLWCAAADMLLVLGTKRDVQSYRYTSPMKIFEYLAAARPIVASNTPAIREIVSADEVFFYEPDDERDLARVVQSVSRNEEESSRRVAAATRRATLSSWSSRAERIETFIENTLREPSHD